MKPWHRWILFAFAVPWSVTGMLAMYDAFWWINDPLARCLVFGTGVLIFGVGMALVEGAARRD